MSDYKQLVKDLNDLQELPPMECVEEYHNAHERKLYGRAASELERLAFTCEAWAGAAEDYVRRTEAAEAEVIRLTPMVTRGALETADAIEALQSEVERLREVLKNIAYFEPDRNSWSVKQARSALEAKP